MRLPRLSSAEMAVLLLLGTLLLLFYLLNTQQHQARQVVMDRTFQDARLLTDFAERAQQQYAESIRGQMENGLSRFTSEDEVGYGEVHFPATFARRLTEDFSSDHPETEFRIYSRFPVQGQPARDLDAFAEAALSRFDRPNPPPDFREIYALPDGAVRLRYAAPITLQQGCLGCHNDPAISTRVENWTESEVRGVREVSILVPQSAFRGPMDMRLLLGLIVLACLMSTFLVLPAVRKEVAQRLALGQATQVLKRQAETDPLSGLANRRFFEQTLRNGSPNTENALGLILIDVDDFKPVNDTYGHEIGDRLIGEIGRLLTERLRAPDTGMRLGGDEFAVLCRDKSEDSLARLSERLSRDIAATGVVTGLGAVSVTVSIGYAVSRAGEGLKSVYRRADTNLYIAKSRGGGQVFGARSGGPSGQGDGDDLPDFPHPAAIR